MVASFSTLPSSSSSVWTVNTAHLRMLFFRVSLDPPKPPVPPDPVPPEPPPRCCSDFPSSPSWYSLFVGSSISFPSSLRLIINYMQVFSMINLLDPCVAFVSSGDTSIAIVRPITAVCSLFPEAIRFSYGSYASFTSFFHVYMICRFSKVEMGKCSANSWSWNCDSRLFTIAFGLHKDTNWNESFFGVCGFAVASCLDMLSSKTLEVPLRDISVAYRSSTYTLVAEDIVAKTALSLNNALLLA
ncbi:hypothetical protein ISN44_As02g019300 [Arabidopsis suecica]|nr:hypothetical protein ISN44_As02g019300 [Arabidopsis suecica]